VTTLSTNFEPTAITFSHSIIMKFTQALAVSALSLNIPMAFAIPFFESLSVTIKDEGSDNDRSRCNVNRLAPCWERPSVNSPVVEVLRPHEDVELICRAQGERGEPQHIKWYQARINQGRQCYVPEHLVRCDNERPPTTTCSREKFHALPKGMMSDEPNDRERYQFCHVLEGIPCLERPSLGSPQVRIPDFGAPVFVNCMIEERENRDIKSWYKTELIPGSNEYCYTPHFQKAPRPIQCGDKPQVCRKNENDDNNDNDFFSKFNMDL